MPSKYPSWMIRVVAVAAGIALLSSAGVAAGRIAAGPDHPRALVQQRLQSAAPVDPAPPSREREPDAATTTAAAFVKVAGFQLRPLTKEQLAKLMSSFASQTKDPGVRAVFKTMSTRRIIAGDAGDIGVVLAFPVGGTMASSPLFQDGVVAGFAKGSGVTPKIVTVAGLQIARFAPENGVVAYVFTSGRNLIMVIAKDGSPSSRFIERYVKALEGVVTIPPGVA